MGRFGKRHKKSAKYTDFCAELTIGENILYYFRMILRSIIAIASENARPGAQKLPHWILAVIHKKYRSDYTVLPKFQKPLYKKSTLYYNVSSEKLRNASRNFSEGIYRLYKRGDAPDPSGSPSSLHGGSKAESGKVRRSFPCCAFCESARSPDASTASGAHQIKTGGFF